MRRGWCILWGAGSKKQTKKDDENHAHAVSTVFAVMYGSIGRTEENEIRKWKSTGVLAF